MHIVYIHLPQDMAFRSLMSPYSLTKCMQARIFRDILTSRAGRGTKVLQFDVCCKAIDQNFDCGCDSYTILHLDSLLIEG